MPGKSLRLSAPPFPHLQKGGINSHFPQLREGLVLTEGLAQGLHVIALVWGFPETQNQQM